MGNNWLGVLYGPDKSKSGPGGCARCHIAANWKSSPTELNIDNWQNPGPTATGTATATSVFGDMTNLASAWNGSTGQKKANSIECLLCHASNYNPPAIAGKAGMTYNYGSGADAKTVFNAGTRKPAWINDSIIGSTYFAYTTNTAAWQKRYDAAGTLLGTEPVWIEPDISTNSIASISNTPANEACNRCHDYAGGGDRNKRGMWFRPQYDVHASISCLDCHKTEKALKDANYNGSGALTVGTGSSHKMALGMSTDIWARDIFVTDDSRNTDKSYDNRANHASECNNSDCHGNRPHKSKLINDHYAAANSALGDGTPSGKVDCRTCHIPWQYGQKTKDFARLSGQPSRMNADLASATLNPKTGLYGTYTENRTKGNITDVTEITSYDRPAYKWFNGIANAEKHHPDFDSVDRNTATAKIAPFTQYYISAPVDDNGKKIPLKLGVIFTTGNVVDAIKKTADETTIEANTSFNKAFYDATKTNNADLAMSEFTENNFLIGHRVAPKTQALKCADCHSSNSAMDFEGLGYTETVNVNGTDITAAEYLQQRK